MDPAHPALGLRLPITTLLILACTMAPAHIWQGSKVMYIVQSSRRQSPAALLALRIARSSAWASVFLSVFLRLYPLAIILSSFTINRNFCELPCLTGLPDGFFHIFFIFRRRHPPHSFCSFRTLDSGCTSPRPAGMEENG